MLSATVLWSTAVAASFPEMSLGPEVKLDAAGPRSMIAHKMPDFAEQDGAVCLDGSPGMFYFAPAADAANANNWEIYFQGGG
jgi:hypothetical protein